jgi:hypothetical protein
VCFLPQVQKIAAEAEKYKKRFLEMKEVLAQLEENGAESVQQESGIQVICILVIVYLFNDFYCICVILIVNCNL